MKNLNRLLVSSLIRLVGNKRYFNEIENLLNRLDETTVTPAEKQAIQYLIHDINSAQNDARNSKRMF
jgi:hypothetical protein